MEFCGTSKFGDKNSNILENWKNVRQGKRKIEKKLQAINDDRNDKSASYLGLHYNYK